MKKLLAIPLLFLYTLAVSGVMVQMHFCGSDLESWKVNTGSSACCCEGGNTNTYIPQEEKDCCSDKTLVVKTVQDQNISNGMQLLFGEWHPGYTPVNAIFGPDPDVEAKSFASYYSNAPPGLWQNIPLFLLHQRFIVYS